MNPVAIVLIVDLLLALVWLGITGYLQMFAGGVPSRYPGRPMSSLEWMSWYLRYHIEFEFLQVGIVQNVLRMIVFTTWVQLGLLALLACLRQTLSRGGVRAVQLLRVVSLGGIATSLAYGIVRSAMTILSYSQARPPLWVFVPFGNQFQYLLPQISFADIAALLFLLVHVSAGLRLYLRLPRAELIATAAIVVLVLGFVTFRVLSIIVIGRV